MPTVPPSSPQLDLLPGLSPASGDALARYEALRPILQGQRTLKQQSQATGCTCSHDTGHIWEASSPHRLHSL